MVHELRKLKYTGKQETRNHARISKSKIRYSHFLRNQQKRKWKRKVKDYVHFFLEMGKDQRARAGISMFLHKKFERYIKSFEAYKYTLEKHS